FYESARKFYLLKDVQGKYFSLEEYTKLVESSQTDKDSTLIYLYTTDPVAQYSYIRDAEEKGYSVLLIDGELDSHFMSMLESKESKLRFVRVDSDIPERLIVKEDAANTALSAVESDILQGIFSADLPEVENATFVVSLENLGENAAPATITQNEFMRRMKQMAQQQPGMMGGMDLPDSYQLVVNTNRPVVKKILSEASESLESKISSILSEISTLNNEITELRKNDSAEGVSEDTKKENQKLISEKENKVAELRKNQNTLISDYAKDKSVIRQIIDLALLQSGLLKGKELSEFIHRSISLL
ncbi:MAG: molecular chaperone HtpG, partial [Muribaculaceae bacterium]|nr:molecular chaperone HtpG [Muribaculaceae bacterium]